MSAIVIQAWHLSIKTITYITSQNCMYVFHKRKFPKLASETQVSFVNEAAGLT
jgi:hypothetical protein